MWFRVHLGIHNSFQNGRQYGPNVTGDLPIAEHNIWLSFQLHEPYSLVHSSVELLLSAPLDSKFSCEHWWMYVGFTLDKVQIDGANYTRITWCESRYKIMAFESQLATKKAAKFVKQVSSTEILTLFYCLKQYFKLKAKTVTSWNSVYSHTSNVMLTFNNSVQQKMELLLTSLRINH